MKFRIIQPSSSTVCVCVMFRRETKNEADGAPARFDPYYFDVPPAQFVYSHLPDDESQQLLATPVTTAEFETFPLLGRGFFSRYGLCLLSHPKSPIKIVYVYAFKWLKYRLDRWILCHVDSCYTRTMRTTCWFGRGTRQASWR